MRRSTAARAARQAPRHLTPPCGTQPNTPAHHALCPGYSSAGACECTDQRCPHVIKSRQVAEELRAGAVPVTDDQLDLFGGAA